MGGGSGNYVDIIDIGDIKGGVAHYYKNIVWATRLIKLVKGPSFLLRSFI